MLLSKRDLVEGLREYADSDDSVLQHRLVDRLEEKLNVVVTRRTEPLRTIDEVPKSRVDRTQLYLLAALTIICGGAWLSLV